MKHPAEVSIREMAYTVSDEVIDKCYQLIVINEVDACSEELFKEYCQLYNTEESK